MSEVKRWKLKGFLPGVEGECKAVFQPTVVMAEDFDRVTAERDAALASLDSADASAQTLHEVITRLRSERDALQQRLTAADELVCERTASLLECGTRRKALELRADVLEGLSRTSLIAMKRIYQAGYDRIIAAGGTCDTPEYMMESDPTVREIRAALKPAEGGGDAVGRMSLSDKALGLIDEEIRNKGLPS